MAHNQRPLASAALALVLSLFPDVGWAQSMEERLGAAVEANEIVGLHSTVVMLDGERIAEAYFRGEDERWGTPIGSIDHGPNTLHDLRSVTKSVVGLLYGIALSEGAVPPLDTPLLDLFPEYADLRDGTRREEITVEDALTMQMGTEWDESLPYTDPRNSEIAMELSEDRYRFVLSRPMVTEPGTTWTYNGGAVALIAKLIANGTGQEIDAFAETRLFDPLGIEIHEWVRGADDVPSAASGLRLTTRDLAKIGVMIAQNGSYNGQEIVPPSWLESSFRPAATIQEGFGYGFLWYLTKGPGGDPILIAVGNGGQRLTVQPNAEFVVATFAGNYNDPNAWQTTVRVLLDFAIPEVVRYRQQ
ncbi:serine hydrolase domain-containing protein [Thalassococcus lentus]|uniref:Serine hydrolase n=1 Tax=Thalassococcus lentus TaxID=1210524 RepID=A0ABT4XMJ9_9RHOB|nr:serine hydrolase [Thalassococcus lentus]MDA7423168.1 serine hydrolase [Thalassococcus lentus]